MVAVERCDCWFVISPEPQPAKKRKVWTDGKARGAND